MAVVPLSRPQTAWDHLSQRVPVLHRQEPVHAALARLVAHALDSVETLYIVDGNRRLQGLVALRDLLAAPADGLMEQLMRPVPAVALAELDQEEVAGLAVRHGLDAVPVVDRQGRLLGVVPARALIAILRSEHIEDLNLMAGLQHDSLRSLRAMTEPPLQRARERLPWLLVGLLGSGMATWVVSRSQTLLSERVAVAFFMPAIVYLADAIGTQSEAIAVRGFSINHVPLRRAVVGEIQTGFLIGLILGAISWPAVWWAYGDGPLALAVALAIFMAGGMATSIGILLPWALERLAMDPAFGSGPVATVIQDVLSLLIYFLLVQLLVGL